MSPKMGDELALALALEGRVDAPRGETAELVALAETLASLPEPEIDEGFAAALEAQLLTDGLEQSIPVARPALTLVAAPQKTQKTEKQEPVRRDSVVQLPKRRFVVRRSIAAVAAAAMLSALPIAAVASSLPGSPGYGAKLWFERMEIRLIGGPVEDGFKHAALSQRRISEATQLEALGGDPDLIAATLKAAESHLWLAKALIIENTSDPATLVRLASIAREAESRAAEVAPGSMTMQSALEGTLQASRTIQEAVAAILGGPVAAPVAVALPDLQAPTTSTVTTSGSTSTDATQTTSSSPTGSTSTKTDPSDDDDTDESGTGKRMDDATDACQIPASMQFGDLLATVTIITCGR